LEVLDLVRRAAVQIRAPRQELRPFGGRLYVAQDLGEAELHVIDRQIARGAVVEMLERLRRAAGLFAAYRELRAAAGDGDVERRFNLPQVLVERAAKAGEALVVDGIEAHLDRLGPHP